MQLHVKSADSTSSLEVNDAVFDVRANDALVHQVVTAYLAGARAGTRAHKTRAQVSGGNSKPWRQKGTGRARAGSSRSPIWRGGGRTFAAVPVSYRQKVNRKMYRGAMRVILSELHRAGRLNLVDEFDVSEHKTKAVVEKLHGLELTDVLIVVEEVSENLALAVRNLHWVAVIPSAHADPLNLLAYKEVLCTVGALKLLEERVV